MVADVISVLLGWLPYTLKQAETVDSDVTHPSLSQLLKHPGIEKLAANPSVKPVLGAARMLSKDSMLPPDHLARSLTSWKACVALLHKIPTSAPLAR